MRYNGINITDEIKARGVTPSTGQLLSFDSNNLPIWLTVTGGMGGAGATAALVDITTSDYREILKNNSLTTDKFLRISDAQTGISPLIWDVIVTTTKTGCPINQNETFARFLNADWSFTGDYSDVQALIGFPTTNNFGLWSKDVDAIAGLGDIVIHGSTGGTGGFYHYAVKNNTFLNGTPPNVNTSAYQVLPKRPNHVNKYGYIEEWNRIKLGWNPELEYYLVMNYVEDSLGNAFSFPASPIWLEIFQESFSPFQLGMDYANNKTPITLFPWGNPVFKNNRIENSVIELYDTRVEEFFHNELLSESVIGGNKSVPSEEDPESDSYVPSISMHGNKMINSKIIQNLFRALPGYVTNTFRNNDIYFSSIQNSSFQFTDVADNQIVNSSLTDIVTTDPSYNLRISISKNSFNGLICPNLNFNTTNPDAPYSNSVGMNSNIVYNSTIGALGFTASGDSSLSGNQIYNSTFEYLYLNSSSEPISISENFSYSAGVLSEGLSDAFPLVGNSSLSKNTLYPNSSIQYGESSDPQIIVGNRLDPSAIIRNPSSIESTPVVIRDCIFHSESALRNVLFSGPEVGSILMPGAYISSPSESFDPDGDGRIKRYYSDLTRDYVVLYSGSAPHMLPEEII